MSSDEMTARRLTVLLTNDDGYAAEGLLALREALSSRQRVVVVAPEKEQSGIGHAFTYSAGLRCRRLRAHDGIAGYAVEGTPSDCVKLGISKLLERVPDAVVSGINVGENTGMAGHYSGTLAAAREGAFWGVPAVAFSVCQEAREHMRTYACIAADILGRLLALGADGFGSAGSRAFFSVNFPACAPRACRGTRVTRQSLAFFDDRYEVIREEGAHAEYRLSGARRAAEQSAQYDSRAVEMGYITITPLTYDATADEVLARIASRREIFCDSMEC